MLDTSVASHPFASMLASIGQTTSQLDDLGFCPQLSARPQPSLLDELLDDDSDGEIVEWSEDAVVQLHWLLLEELRKLPDPATPIEEKIETLDWALADPSFDGKPFSFASCVRVVSASPLSPAPYTGRVDVQELRDWIRRRAAGWLRQTLARYPRWAQELFCSNPQFAAAQLAANPQWLNEQIRAREASAFVSTAQPDLFGLEVGAADRQEA